MADISLKTKFQFDALNDTSSNTSFDENPEINDVLDKKDKSKVEIIDKNKKGTKNIVEKSKEDKIVTEKPKMNSKINEKSKSRKIKKRSKLEYYKKCLRAAGVRIKASEFFKACDSEKSQKKLIVDHLEKIGVKSPINLASCEKYKHKHDLLKEVEELDKDITINQGTGRATRRNSTVISSHPKTSSDDVISITSNDDENSSFSDH